MYTFLLVIHVVVCFFLVAVILLQAGKGGGMSETLGGSITQTILGTRSTAFMTKLTAVCAVIFIFTSLSLTYFSAQKRVSLFRHYRIPKTAPAPESKSSPDSDQTSPSQPSAQQSAPAVIEGNSPAPVQTNETPISSDVPVEQQSEGSTSGEKPPPLSGAETDQHDSSVGSHHHQE